MVRSIKIPMMIISVPTTLKTTALLMSFLAMFIERIFQSYVWFHH